MADNSLVVPFDNFVQDANQSLEEVMQAVAAVNSGTRPSVAEVVRDATTGKLIQVRLTFPDTVATAAVDAINANPGVVSTCLNLPIPASQTAQLLNTFGENPIAMIWSGAWNNSNAKILYLGSPTGDPIGFTFLARLAQSGVETVVSSGVPIEPFAFLQFVTGFPGDFIFNAVDTLTLNFIDGSQLVVSPNADFTIPELSIESFWIDSNGKIYPRNDFRGKAQTYDFATSCLGPL